MQLGGRNFGSAWANSKKEAEQLAALQALVELQLAARNPETNAVELLEMDDQALAERLAAIVAEEPGRDEPTN